MKILVLSFLGYPINIMTCTMFIIFNIILIIVINLSSLLRISITSDNISRNIAAHSEITMAEW